MKNYLMELMAMEERALRAERLLNADLTTKEVGRAHHIADLEQKNKRLKKEVRMMQQKAEVFNRQLFATGLIVNCTGCIPGAPANYQDLTEEKVQEVEHIAQRLRTWWNNNRKLIPKKKLENCTQPSDQQVILLAVLLQQSGEQDCEREKKMKIGRKQKKLNGIVSAMKQTLGSMPFQMQNVNF